MKREEIEDILGLDLAEIRKRRMSYLKHVFILAVMRWFVWCETEAAQSRKSKYQKIDYMRKNENVRCFSL